MHKMILSWKIKSSKAQSHITRNINFHPVSKPVAFQVRTPPSFIVVIKLHIFDFVMTRNETRGTLKS